MHADHRCESITNRHDRKLLPLIRLHIGGPIGAQHLQEVRLLPRRRATVAPPTGDDRVPLERLQTKRAARSWRV